MSEIATEIIGSTELISTVEFVGKTFEERKQALQKVDTFKKFTEQALADSVAINIDKEVTMTFIPSAVLLRGVSAWVSCYSLKDSDPQPISRNVTIRSVNDDTYSATVTSGELKDSQYDSKWVMDIRDIITLEPINEAHASHDSSGILEQEAILDSAAYWGLDHGSLPNNQP